MIGVNTEIKIISLRLCVCKTLINIHSEIFLSSTKYLSDSYFDIRSFFLRHIRIIQKLCTCSLHIVRVK